MSVLSKPMKRNELQAGKMRYLIFLSLILTLSSCGVARNAAGALGVGKAAAKRTDVEIDGTRFRAKISTEREDKRSFLVTGTPFAVNPEGAVEAAQYEATRYCLLTYGGSDIEWTIGPKTPVEELPVENDVVQLDGRCTQL